MMRSSFLYILEVLCCLPRSSVENYRVVLYKCIPTCWVELMSKMWILISIFISIIVYLSVPSFKSFLTNKCVFVKCQMIIMPLGPLHIILTWCIWSWWCNLQGTHSIVKFAWMTILQFRSYFQIDVHIGHNFTNMPVFVKLWFI
jgi:hypothetical protein